MNFSVNLAPSAIEELDEIADREGISKSSVVRLAVDQFLNIKNYNEKARALDERTRRVHRHND
jgi:hypothetical protein